jgi:ATP-dependent DNA helicase RecG
MIMLYVKEIVALANSSGEYLLLGVEDNKEITGCTNYDLQNIIESVYDRIMPNLFTRAKVVEL